jgi:hypothetical protein
MVEVYVLSKEIPVIDKNLNCLPQYGGCGILTKVPTDTYKVKVGHPVIRCVDSCLLPMTNQYLHGKQLDEFTFRELKPGEKIIFEGIEETK